MTEERFTLAEAKVRIALEECRTRGHSWDFDLRQWTDEAPPGLSCRTCGWHGTITMGDKP